MRSVGILWVLLLGQLGGQEPQFSWQIKGHHARELKIELQPDFPLDAGSPRAVVGWWLGVLAAEERGRASVRAQLHDHLHAAMQPWYESCFAAPHPGPEAGLQHAAMTVRNDVLPARIGAFESLDQGGLLVYVERSHMRYGEDNVVIEGWDQLLRFELEPGDDARWKIISIATSLPRSPNDERQWRTWQPPALVEQPAYPPEPAQPSGGAGALARFLLLELLPFRHALAAYLRASVQRALSTQLGRVLAVPGAAAPPPSSPCEVSDWRQLEEIEGCSVVEAQIRDGPCVRFALEADGGSYKLRRCGQVVQGRFRELPFDRLMR